MCTTTGVMIPNRGGGRIKVEVSKQCSADPRRVPKGTGLKARPAADTNSAHVTCVTNVGHPAVFKGNDRRWW